MMVSNGGAEQLAERIQSQRELFARIASPPNLTVRSSRNPRSRGAFFAFSRHSTCPGYLRDPFLSKSYMPRVRTHFLLSLFSLRAECIVEGRLDFVTFCLQKYATCYVRVARMAHVSDKRAPGAILQQASGDNVTFCLPSGLISWFEPRLPLLPLQLHLLNAILRLIPRFIL
jgi:hypothetical protein